MTTPAERIEAARAEYAQIKDKKFRTIALEVFDLGVYYALNAIDQWGEEPRERDRTIHQMFSHELYRHLDNAELHETHDGRVPCQELRELGDYYPGGIIDDGFCAVLGWDEEKREEIENNYDPDRICV